jgi:hypothetical protein
MRNAFPVQIRDAVYGRGATRLARNSADLAPI